MLEMHAPMFFLLFTLFVIITAFFMSIYCAKPCETFDDAASSSWEKTFLNDPSKEPQELMREIQEELRQLHIMKSSTIVDTSRAILDETEQSILEIQNRLVDEAGSGIREEARRGIQEEAEQQMEVLRQKRLELQEEMAASAAASGSEKYVMSENTLGREWTGYHGNSFGMLFTTSRDIRFGRARIDADKSGRIVFRVSEFRGNNRSFGSTITERSFDVSSGAQWIDLNLSVPGNSSKEYVIWYPRNKIRSDVSLKRTRDGNRFSESSIGPVTFKGGVSDHMSVSNTRWYYLFQLEIHTAQGGGSQPPSPPPRPTVVGMRGGNGTSSGSDLPSGSVYFHDNGRMDATFRVLIERNGQRSEPASRELRIRSFAFRRPRVRVKFDKPMTGNVILQVRNDQKNESGFKDTDEQTISDQQEVLFRGVEY